MLADYGGVYGGSWFVSVLPCSSASTLCRSSGLALCIHVLCTCSFAPSGVFSFLLQIRHCLSFVYCLSLTLNLCAEDLCVCNCAFVANVLLHPSWLH